jgi:hypothetical protein
MRALLRETAGLVLLVSSLAALGRAVIVLGRHDYVAAVLFVAVGLSLVGAGLELLRPGVGE